LLFTDIAIALAVADGSDDPLNPLSHALARALIAHPYFGPTYGLCPAHNTVRSTVDALIPKFANNNVAVSVAVDLPADLPEDEGAHEHRHRQADEGMLRHNHHSGRHHKRE
jgi:hypothetical protein